MNYTITTQLRCISYPIESQVFMGTYQLTDPFCYKLRKKWYVKLVIYIAAAMLTRLEKKDAILYH
jgi:hypothetical protein